ncbi:MAG: glycosyltransferase family 87 protein [Vicinamibacterales bacterium]
MCLFLAWFASFYRSGFGFTYVLLFTQRSADLRVHAMHDIPVYVHPGGGYDGQYYAQLAVDPLLRDPSIDTALDSPPFRARRILFSWTAWLLGLGRPFWVVQAYCVQNVLFWAAFAIWLRRRLATNTVEDLLVWVACLFTPGMLDSTRMALIDGPSALVLAMGVEAIERGRPWLGSIVLGIAGLARETNLLAGVSILPRRLALRTLLIAMGAGLLVVLPTLLWLDYLRSIYRSLVTQSLDQLTMPFVAYQEAWHRLFRVARRTGFISVRALPWFAFVGVTAQALYVVALHRWRSAWWRVGVAFAGLMLIMKGEIWLGAYLRVLLPLTLAFNLSLPRDRSFWPLFVVGNLGLATSVQLIASAF